MLPFDAAAAREVLFTAGAVFLVVVWLWLLIVTVSDLLRRSDLSTGRKAAWMALLVGVPYAGLLAYIARESGGMAQRRKAPSDDLRQALGLLGQSAVDELVKLDRLRARQAISPDEYKRLRSQLFG